MATPENAGQVWRFGVFEVDTKREELRRSGVPVKMREQSFRILVYLLDHAGEIVTREDLRRVLWPCDTFVDFDHSLNTAVMKLRDALGDSTSAPLYIETVPKKGYRFIAPASPGAGGRSGAANSGDDTASPASTEERHEQPVFLRDGRACGFVTPTCAQPLGNRINIWIGCTGGGRIGVVSCNARHSNAEPKRDYIGPADCSHHLSAGRCDRSGLLTRRTRNRLYLGRRERRRYDVYAQLVGADLPLRLTYNKAGVVGAPAWSPDGSQIAFSRCDGENDGVFVVPALGGAERQLTTVGCLYTLPGPVAWISDGTEMLMIHHCLPEGPYGIVLFSLSTAEKKCLTNSGSAPGSDTGYGFSLSPDGTTIAFARTGVSLCCNIYTVPLTGGAVVSCLLSLCG